MGNRRDSDEMDGGDPRSGSSGDRDSAARRDVTPTLLLRAAKQLFAGRGVHGASVRDIAASAGVNSALVRYHFGSKDGLYTRVVDELLADFRDAIAERVTDEACGIELMEQLLDAFLDFLLMDADNAPLFHRVVLDTPTTVWARAREQYGDRLRNWGERGAWSGSTSIGEVPDVALTIFAGALLPFAHGPFLREVVGDDPLSLESGERRRVHLRLAMRAAVASVTRAPGSAKSAGMKR